MHGLSALLFAVSGNMDNLVVGLSYGIRGIRLGWAAQLLVGIITSSGTAAAMALGKSLLLVLPERTAGSLGGGMILAIGLWGLLRGWLERGEEEHAPEKALSWKEAAVLGISLSINNVGLGVGASITGLPLGITVLCSFVLGWLLMFTGNRLGTSRLRGAVGRAAEPLANLLMVLLGIGEICF